MKKALFIVTAIGVFITAGWQVVMALNATEQTKEAAGEIKPQEVGNKICPVTGDKIDEKTKVTVEYEGKIYNLCCSGCINIFKADPQKYIKKIEEEKQAVSK